MDGLGWQVRAMLASIAAGLLMGALYDLCAFLRRVFGLRRAATALVDLFYWLFSSAVAFSILMRANRGEVRLYVLVGIAIGFWVYTFTGRSLLGPVLTVIEWATRRMAWSSRRGMTAVRRDVTRTKRRISRVVMQGFSLARRRLSRADGSEIAREGAAQTCAGPSGEVNE
ncbi:MAG: spore cortex biosynthesis protein YabQ [Firmicutes bacterium]|jgi:spore cortex biosynthesis protein YabQ|nr:spore cortex biosynthesis protein YabQ [Bacillota bacterium]MDD4337448.1 spore cortex biosynthesis protein YabQ [Bacillota bacterium]